MENKWSYIYWSCIWLSVALCVGFGLYFTKSPWCFLLLFIPYDMTPKINYKRLKIILDIIQFV